MTINQTVGGTRPQPTQDLLKGAGFGGLIGMFLGNPILGALGGIAYKLFTTDGLADSAKKILGDVTQGLDPQGTLGTVLGGSPSGAQAQGAEPPRTEVPQQQKSGLPGWVKALGIGAAALAGVSFLQNNVASTFMGMPYYGGFGLGLGGMGLGGFGGYGAGFGYPFF